MTDAIRTESLGKTYPGAVEAVRGVNLTVRPGEIFGFLGPNGAGKTTMISMLTTLLRPTAGRAEVDGLDVVRYPEKVRRRIGLVFQRSTSDETLTGRENLEIAAGLHGISPAAARPRIREVLERLDLREAADRRVGGYSGGMRRRLEIAVGIVHEPEILFLDEPTLGLDPQGRAGFWQYVRHLRKSRGLTIFLTTHYLEEADQLSDRISIIDHGSILKTGSPEGLKRELGGDIVHVCPTRPSTQLAEVLLELPGALSVESEGTEGGYRVKVARSESLVPEVVRACDSARIDIGAISTQKPSLDEVFLAMTGREYREENDAHGNGSAPHPSPDGRRDR